MRRNINILRVILIILLIALFVKIFDFSSQDGEKSGNLSREITITITKDIKSIQRLEKTKKEKVLEKIEHVIRKLAHFLLYTLVGILTMSLMSTYKIKQVYRVESSISIGVLYAISDEIHQSFVPGRGASAQDVLLDSFGIVFGIFTVIVIIKLYKKMKNMEKNNH